MKDVAKEYIPDGIAYEQHGDVVSFEVSPAEVVSLVRDYIDKNLPLTLIDATDERADNGCFKVWYVFGLPEKHYFIVPYIRVEKTEEFPSVASITPAAGGYERKIRTFFGLEPVGNPDSRPLILHENWPKGTYPLRKDFKQTTRPKTAKNQPYEFQKVDGEGIYEIPVGPIHAGIIEPGHFRFSVAGETIMLLEARLGYVHKGTEKLFENLPLDSQLRLAEKISGDSSFSHSLAFCQAVEQLADIKVPARALYLRTIFAEMERLANHIGDIGFMMLDTGFNFGGSNGARLREMVMRINGRLTGSRFLRGVTAIGGVTKDLSADECESLIGELTVLMADFEEVMEIAEESDPLLNRLKTAGPLSKVIAKDYGVVGVPARAVGLKRDARVEHPYAAYGILSPRMIVTEKTGDVHARFVVRIREARNAVSIVKEAIKALPNGAIIAAPLVIKLQKNAVAIGCVEGWRGEIIHFVTTDAKGDIQRVAVRDPSFINWQVVGFCGQGQVVPDFPLINKSFNLSYTGNDL